MGNLAIRTVVVRVLMVAAIASVAGCAEKEEVLPGQRYDLRDFDAATSEYNKRVESGVPQPVIAPQAATKIPLRPFVVTGEARPVSLPGQQVNADWTHINGHPTHQITHPALGTNLTQVWSVSIGKGNSKRNRLTADPVVSGGRVFTVDSDAFVSAFSTGGKLLWQADLNPPGEEVGTVSGGGIAVAGDRVFVTTGYGTLQALDAASGATVWIKKFDAIPNSAPTVSNGYVYMTTRDSKAWAIQASDGRILWDLSAGEAGPVVIDGASPAVSDRAVLFPFGSGDIVAALKLGGVRLWSTALTGQRRGAAYASISDISSDPVVVGNTVYLGTPTGRLAALDATSGERIWTAQYGASSAVWPAGNAVFLVSDQAELVRLDAATGEMVWSATLPLYTVEKISKRKGVYTNFGPVLAGGRLIVTSSDQMIREVDPVSGRLIRTTPLGAPAAANPVVADRTLYVVTGDGQLRAFR